MELNHHSSPSDRVPASGVTSAASVTQSELEEYRRLKEASRLCQTVRDELVGRLGAGAAVEPGALKAWVQTSCQRRLTFASVERACGSAEAERLQLLVE